MKVNECTNGNRKNKTETGGRKGMKEGAREGGRKIKEMKEFRVHKM